MARVDVFRFLFRLTANGASRSNGLAMTAVCGLVIALLLAISGSNSPAVAQAGQTRQLGTLALSDGSGRVVLALRDGPLNLGSLIVTANGRGSVTIERIRLLDAERRGAVVYNQSRALNGGQSVVVRLLRRARPVRAIEVSYRNRTGQMRLVLNARVLPARPDSVPLAERLAWNRARSSNTTAAYRTYLRAFPNGAYRRQASAALRRLSRRSAPRRARRAENSDRELGRGRRAARPPQPPRPNLAERRNRAAAPPERGNVPARRDAGRASRPTARSGNVGRGLAAQPRQVQPSAISCVEQGTCAPVQVFYGTNRRPEGRQPALKFGWRDDGKLNLGRAVVTVPLGGDRRVGQVPVPGWLDLIFWRIPREGDPKRHFVIVRDRMRMFAAREDFVSAVRRYMARAAFKDHAFVFVHGYAVSFDEGLKRTAQLAYDLGTPNLAQLVASGGVTSREPHAPFGTPFLYSWPSNGRFAGYVSDIEKARRAVDHLKTFLKLVIEQTGARRVHLIAHSMGNVALLNALKEYVEERKDGQQGAELDQVVLAAPDMSPLEFGQIAGRIRPLANGMTLYASARDAAMLASRNVHDGYRVGDVVEGRPAALLSVPGVAKLVDTIDISDITDCYFCSGHVEYVEQPELLGDIARLLRRGTRPPHQRSPQLQQRATSGEPFWRYLRAEARRRLQPQR